METAPDGREILYAATTPGKRHDFIMSVHLDVVAPGTPTQFTLKRSGDRVEGRGVNDCKGCAVVAAEVLSALVGKNVSAACMFGPDEEIGGAGTRWMVEEKGYVPGRMVIVVDSDYGSVCYAHKGQTFVSVTARGRSGHSSEPWLCDDSITKVMLGYAKIREEWDRRHPLPEDKWSDVVVPTLVNADGGALNMIPPEMKLVLNLRSVNPGAKDELVALCREALPGCDVQVMRHSPPVNSDPDHPLVRHLQRSMAARLGHKVPLTRMLAATDARWFAGCGVPIAMIGAKGGGAHAVDEHASISSLDDMLEYLKTFFEESSGR
jgi:acetylornithine deacetylase/succinyl-diaminopimelate desuccinylase-like protein